MWVGLMIMVFYDQARMGQLGHFTRHHRDMRFGDLCLKNLLSHDPNLSEAFILFLPPC